MNEKPWLSFEEWAFGPGPFERLGLDRMKAWNERHAEKSGYTLFEDGNILEDLRIMKTIWEYYKENGDYPLCQKD